MTSERELFSGIMIDGTLEADVPDEIASLPDWKNSIFIGIGSAKHGNNSILASIKVSFFKKAHSSCYCK
jgi:hypothetical protein